MNKLHISKKQNRSIRFRYSEQGFTLIELLVVLTLLSMTAGIVLPSASIFLRKKSIETLSHNIAILSREAFHKSIFTGSPLLVKYNKMEKELAVYTDIQNNPVKITNMFLKPLTIPANCELQWPQKGWKVIPEGFCENTQIRIRDKTTSELITLKFRPYDARLEIVNSNNSNL